jgi:hypothetical protein
MLAFGPLSTVAFEMKSASMSCVGFFTRAFATALSMTFLRTGAPAFVVNSRICNAYAASLPRTRFAIIRAFRGEIRAYIALALLIIGDLGEIERRERIQRNVRDRWGLRETWRAQFVSDDCVGLLCFPWRRAAWGRVEGLHRRHRTQSNESRAPGEPGGSAAAWQPLRGATDDGS